MGIPKFVRNVLMKYFGRDFLLRRDQTIATFSTDFNGEIHKVSQYMLGTGEFESVYDEKLLEKYEDFSLDDLKLLLNYKKKIQSIRSDSRKGDADKAREINRVNSQANQIVDYEVFVGLTLEELSRAVHNKIISINRAMNVDDFENILLSNLKSRIDDLYTKYRPTEKLVIAVDGAAPIAKSKQQRKRRHKSILTKDANINFDSNSITPGTKFMAKLDTQLRAWITGEKDPNGVINNMSGSVIYSGSDEAGEGEQKIFQMYRNNTIEKQKDSIILGLDADLVLMSVCSSVTKLFLYRPNPVGSATIIDVDKLKSAISLNLEKPTALNDFVVLTMLFGNDFITPLPGLFTFAKYDIVLNIYNKMTEPLTYFGQLHFPGLIELFKQLSRYENLLLKDEIEYRSSIKSDLNGLGKIGLSGEFDYGQYRSQWYNYYAPIDAEAAKKYKLRYDSGELVLEMCQNYIEMFQWSYRYFKYGITGADWHSCYKYETSPMISDIYKVLQYLGTLPTLDYNLELKPSKSLSAILALPRLSSPTLKPKLAKFLNEDLAPYYPLGYIVDSITEDHYTIRLPVLPYEYLLKTMKFDDKEGVTLIHKRDPKEVAAVVSVLKQEDIIQKQLRLRREFMKIGKPGTVDVKYGERLKPNQTSTVAPKIVLTTGKYKPTGRVVRNKMLM